MSCAEGGSDKQHRRQCCKIKTNGFWVPIAVEFFLLFRGLRFLEKILNTTTQRGISRRALWLIQKNSQFFGS
jgi:hypothetical protein